MDELTLYEMPSVDVDVMVDFLDSLSLEEVEAGIRKLDTGVDILALAQGIGIVMIEREGLWRQGGYANLRAYRIDQSQRLGMPASTITARRRIGEAWTDYKRDLVKLPIQGNVAKLRYFEQAMRKHGDKRSVLKHFREDSSREFVAYSRPEKKRELQEVKAVVRGGVLLIDDVPVAKLSSELAEGEQAFITTILRKAYSARKGNLLPHILAVYDEGEARAMDGALKKYRAGK